MYSFLWVHNIPLYMCTTTSLSVDGHLGFFHGLAIVNSAAMNTGAHVSFIFYFYYFFRIVAFSGYMPSSGIPGSYGRFIPSFLRNLHTFLHNGFISLHSHWQCRRVPFSPYSLQHLQGRKGDLDVENGLWTQWRGREREECRKQHQHIHTIRCKMDNWWEVSV